MDIKQLIEKMDQFAGEKVGQKPGEQWRGTDKGTPGKKLVGASESVLKDLSKGTTPKTKEQELAEEWATFSEENIGTHPKRPGRASDRHSRGHEPQPRYKTVKAEEGVAYKATNPHPALKDPIVAKVVKQMRPGLKDLDMNNEAFLYFAYEIGKMRAREMWEDYGPAIKYFYQSGIGVNEGWESGPEEYEEPYDDADDAYDRQRQEKIDTEAEREWAKLPKVSTYKLVGRGPNMEPNYEFGDEFDTLEQALEYRAEIMKDPKTPHPEHIGIRTLTRVVDKEQTNENSVTTPQNKAHADQMMKDLTKLQTDVPNPDPELAATIARRKDILTKQTKDLDMEESRGHKIISTKLKNIERERKFAKGELKIPTPQERQAQLAKQKQQVKEYGATGTSSASSAVTQATANPIVTPDDVKKSVAATTALKSATGSATSTTNLMKAIDSASQGTAADAQTMKALEPTLDIVQAAFKDPKLASQFNSFAQQAKQVK